MFFFMMLMPHGVFWELLSSGVRGKKNQKPTGSLGIDGKSSPRGTAALGDTKHPRFGVCHEPFVTATSCLGDRGALVPACFRNSARIPSPRGPLGDESGLEPAGLRGESGESSGGARNPRGNHRQHHPRHPTETPREPRHEFQALPSLPHPGFALSPSPQGALRPRGSRCPPPPVRTSLSGSRLTSC